MTARLNKKREVYTVTLPLDVGTSPKGKWRVREENCVLKQRRETGRMCVSAFVCVCLSACDHSSVSECTRVCMLSSVTVCVLFGVCTGVYLYKNVGGVLDLWVTVQTLRHAPFHPLIQVAVEAFP